MTKFGPPSEFTDESDGGEVFSSLEEQLGGVRNTSLEIEVNPKSTQATEKSNATRSAKELHGNANEDLAFTQRQSSSREQISEGDKKARRRAKNREAAKRSRERRLNYISELEQTISELQEENMRLRADNLALLNQLDQNHIQQQAQSSSPPMIYLSHSDVASAFQQSLE